MADETTPMGPEVPEDTSKPVEADEVTAKLKDLGVEDDVIIKVKTELGVTTLDDLAVLTADDLTKVGVKLVTARKLEAERVATSVEASAMGVGYDDGVLPMVPSDESLLEELKTGGVLKVEKSTVIAAIRADLGNRVGLFDVPAAIIAAMEEFADKNDEPVDPEFWKLRNQVTRRSYADIFAAIPGFNGSFVTEGRKKQFFDRFNSYLWPEIISFYELLKNWQEAWVGGMNPMAMMSFSMAAAQGRPTPPGMLQPPDTGGLRDQADAVADAVNKVFAGAGVQVAAALAYDAGVIKETLQNDRLPALVGAANRDQMLKQLGVAVPATYPRLELNLTRFVLATMQVKDQPAGSEEVSYFSALCMLGSSIPWDQLSNPGRGRVSGIGGSGRL